MTSSSSLRLRRSLAVASLLGALAILAGLGFGRLAPIAAVPAVALVGVAVFLLATGRSGSAGPMGEGRKPPENGTGIGTTASSHFAAPSPDPGREEAEVRPTLVAESGPLAGNRFPVGPDGLTIGRDPTRCQIVYQAETVSREHARIEEGPEGDLVATNLSTTNKTYVNDEAVSQTTIRPGDRVRVSQVVFRLEGPSSEESR